MTALPLDVTLTARAAAVRLLLTDCDGVLTDGSVYCTPDGEGLLRFSRRDGMGVARLRDAGIETGIVTRESSPIVAQRARKLGLTELHQGAVDKRSVVEEIAARRGLTLDEIGFIGDDVNDLDVLQAVGFSAAPANAEPSVRQAVHYVTRRGGGRGAFRDVAEAVLAARSAGADGSVPADPPSIRLVPAPPRRWVTVGHRAIGDGEPVYVLAEIGINHNGSLELAKKLIDGAVAAGCDAVKFQKRTPELCVPPEQRDMQRDTPWGRITYLEYRKKVEFNFSQYAELDRHCRDRGIAWTASCWDEQAVEFIAAFDPPFFKVASATLTNHELLRRLKSTGKPLMLSTGMSTLDEIDAAVDVVGRDRLLLAHATSTYPCQPRELNLRMIDTLAARFPGVPIGYSGHETGLATTYAAVAMGACFVERHITLDRSLWGSDQAASVEIGGFMRLVRDIRAIEESVGDGVKRVYESEMGALRRLRGTPVRPAADVRVG
ncbi:MAG TPA: N-acetylneuraminate synthase family protein [Gemmatimonadales bacterium]|nr:N-acetylneuraminate synthase family protein [Gemmatimonadales bacterium]